MNKIKHPLHSHSDGDTGEDKYCVNPRVAPEATTKEPHDRCDECGLPAEAIDHAPNGHAFVAPGEAVGRETRDMTEMTDEFQDDWKKYDRAGVAGGWEKIAFTCGWGAGFRLGMKKLSGLSDPEKRAHVAAALADRLGLKLDAMKDLSCVQFAMPEPTKSKWKMIYSLWEAALNAESELSTLRRERDQWKEGNELWYGNWEAAAATSLANQKRAAELESQVRELTAQRDNFEFADRSHSKQLAEHVDFLQERNAEVAELRAAVEKLTKTLRKILAINLDMRHKPRGWQSLTVQECERELSDMRKGRP